MLELNHDPDPLQAPVTAKPKKILYLVTGFPPDVSGASQYNFERAVWLAMHRYFEVVVLAPDWETTPENRNYYLSIPETGLKIETYHSKPWPAYSHTHVPRFRSRQDIDFKIRDHAPDLIVLTDVERLFLLSTWGIPGLEYAREHGIPCIAEYVTDLYSFSASYPGWQWLRSLVKITKLTSYLYNGFNLTFCPSNSAHQSCIEMGVKNSKVIPFYGIDVSDYSPELRDRHILLEWLKPHELHHKVICFVGRLGWEKRVDLLLKAYEQLKQLYPDVSLLVVGDGPIEVVASLREQASNIMDVHFTGFLLGVKKASVLASCDVFCSPCPYETFGRTTVEAMASGVPVVTVDAGAVSEYLQHGINGYLVASEDAEALSETLALVISDPDEQVRQRALEDAKTLSLAEGCKALAKAYEGLLTNPAHL